MDSSTFLMTAIIFFVIGAGVIGVIWILVTLQRNLSSRRKGASSAGKNLYALARLLRDNTTQDLVVEMDGKTYHHASELPPTASRRLSFTSNVLVKWLAETTLPEMPASEEQPSPAVPAIPSEEPIPTAYNEAISLPGTAQEVEPLEQSTPAPFTEELPLPAAPGMVEPVEQPGHSVPAFTLEEQLESIAASSPAGEQARTRGELPISPLPADEGVFIPPEAPVSPFSGDWQPAPSEEPAADQPSASPFAGDAQAPSTAEPTQNGPATSPFESDDQTIDQPLPAPDISEWIPAEYTQEAPPDQHVPPFAPEPAGEVKPVSTQIPDVVSGILNPAAAPKPMFKSIAMQINDILQGRIANTAFENRGITVTDAPDHGVLVTVDGKKYSGVKDVPDEEVRALIRSAVLEWEKQGKPNGK